MGGQATHDTIDAQTIAALRRGGMLPQASVYPAERRATRDRLRRRTPLMRPRSDLLAQVPQTHSPSNLPASGQKIAAKANREGVAERLADPAVHKRVAVDLALSTYDDPRLGDRERSMVQAATHHEANTRDLVPTVPGMGQLLRLVRLDDIHAMARFPRGQELVSSGRLVTCAKQSAGTRWGPSGHTIGNGHLQGALSEAAVLGLRHHPAGQQDWARVEKTHGQGNAWTLLAHQLARAVYERLKRHTALARDTCLHGSGRSAGEPDASRATPGISRSPACARSWGTASLNAKVRLGL
jgi:transposase